MNRLALAAIVLAACAPVNRPTPSATAPRPPGSTTESEWVAASDLASTLAKAAGGQRLAPALRISEHGTVVHRHLTLVAGGCYHVGVAWVFGADIEANVEFDSGTISDPDSDHHLSSPGGAVDFCTETGGGANLTFRPIPKNGPASLPQTLDLVVVYGSATKPPHARVAGR
jgi:hypothetical protein